MRPPLDGPLVITSPWGLRVHPVTGESRHHNGVDLRAAQGELVRAVAGGYVVRVAVPGTPAADGPGGGYVVISHGAPAEPPSTEILWSSYCHLSHVDVEAGDLVHEGDSVGLSGGTLGTPGAGRSTGPHLHWSLWRGNSDATRYDVEPMAYLQKIS